MIKAFPWKIRRRAKTDPQSDSPPPDLGETSGRVYGARLNRVETKLNNLLAAVATAAVSPKPLRRAPMRDTTARQVSLGAAIAEVSRRQQELDMGHPAPTREVSPLTTSLTGLETDMASLAAKLDAIQRERVSRPSPSYNIDELRSEIATMSVALRGVASQGSVASLESAIRDLSAKIQDSRNNGTKDIVLRPVEELVAGLRQSLVEIDPRANIRGLEDELKKLGIRIENLEQGRIDPIAFSLIQTQTREIRDLLSTAIAQPFPIERIERQFADLAQSITQQRNTAEYDEIRGSDSQQPSANFSAIEARLEQIATKVDESLDVARDQTRYRDLSDRIDSVHQGLTARIAEVQTAATPDTSGLERLVQSLTEKIDRVTTNQTDFRAVDALEQQISALGRLIEQSRSSISVNSIERSISELFGEFERTRTASLEVAEETARSAVREALSGVSGSSIERQRLVEEIDGLRAKQDQNGERTFSTLNAVHETLEKVVERLSSFEADLNDRRSALAGPPASDAAGVSSPPQETPPRSPPPPLTQSTDDRASASEPRSGGADDYLIEPGRGFPGRRDPGDKGGQEPTSELTSHEAPTTRSDFIAAARRAAMAAQRETAVALGAVRPAPVAGADAKAGLLDVTRGLFAHYRRPVVLSLAAIFVAVGAYAILKNLGHPSSKLSSIEPPAVAAHVSAPRSIAMQAPRRPPVAAMTNAAKADDNAFSPNSVVTRPPPAAAQNAAAKVDPITTASIPHKADAQPAGNEQPLARLRDAARAGDAHAQFALALEYTEGRLVPRDLAIAAQWYEKAATQGLAPAQYRLASFYEKGLGVDRDMAKAQSLYQKAAEQGNIRAMHNFAVLVADGGDSGRPDYATAAYWFKRAAEFGVRDSQYNYAVLLARGIGISQDFVESYVWFSIAANQGDQDSANKRDDVGARLSPDQLARAKALVDVFRPHTPSRAANDMTMPITSSLAYPDGEAMLSAGSHSPAL